MLAYICCIDDLPWSLEWIKEFHSVFHFLSPSAQLAVAAIFHIIVKVNLLGVKMNQKMNFVICFLRTLCGVKIKFSFFQNVSGLRVSAFRVRRSKFNAVDLFD